MFRGGSVPGNFKPREEGGRFKCNRNRPGMIKTNRFDALFFYSLARIIK